MEDRTAQDQRLVRSVLEGNTEAYAELVERYQKLVAGVAWRYGVARDDVEDVVSEVFIKAYERLDRYRPEHPFSTWLYRVAANHVVDRGRRARKERGRVEMPAAVVDPGPGPGAGLQDDERAGLLHQALEQASPRYREVLFLVYIEGMKIDEVCRSLGLPSGTVKTRLMRGRQALRQWLTRHHPEHFGA